MKRSEVEKFMKGLSCNILGQTEHGVWICECRLTPHKASEWLGRNNRNRSLNMDRANMYARDMVSGNWEYNHEAIAFDGGFMIKDGQHRLKAIQIAGATLLVRVEFNHVFNVCDKARPRSNVDIRKINGARADSRYVATIKSLANIERGVDMSKPCSDAELSETERRYATELDWVDQYMKRRYPAVFYSSMCFAYSISPEKVDEFVSQVCNLTGMQPGTPAAAFASWITSPRGKSVGSGSRKEIALKALTMLKRHMDGKVAERVQSRADIIQLFRDKKERAA